MSKAGPSTGRGLGVLSFVAFLVAFLTARGFATLNPQAVVIEGGIHFHHFWYGLILVVFSGAMGISNAFPAYRRVYAVLFGLGTGLMGDEVGLFLTMGNYDSVLTFYVFVTVFCVGSVILLARDRRQIEQDVTKLEHDELLKLLGLGLASFSFLFVGAGLYAYAVAVVGGGVVLALLGVALGKTKL